MSCAHAIPKSSFPSTFLFPDLHQRRDTFLPIYPNTTFEEFYQGGVTSPCIENAISGWIVIFCIERVVRKHFHLQVEKKLGVLFRATFGVEELKFIIGSLDLFNLHEMRFETGVDR